MNKAAAAAIPIIMVVEASFWARIATEPDVVFFSANTKASSNDVASLSIGDPGCAVDEEDVASVGSFFCSFFGITIDPLSSVTVIVFAG